MHASCRIFAALLAYGLVVAPLTAAAQEAGVAGSYRLAFGDEVNVRLVEDSLLDAEKLAIRPDGRISLPLLGDVQAAGLTANELTRQLDLAYSAFIVHPHVVVNVAVFHPQEITVLGMVNRPGMFEIQHPVTALQAVALAGGFDHDRADRHNLLIHHPDGTTGKLDLLAERGPGAAEPPLLTDGDILEVGEEAGPDWNKLLPTVAYGVTTLSGLVYLFLR